MARTCGACRGSGKIVSQAVHDCRGEGQVEQQRKLSVKIPAGIASGQRLRLQGEGEAGARGGPAGDLYVVIFVQDDERFTRDGNDLHHQADIPFTTLALGGELVGSRHRRHARGEDARGHRHRARTFRVRGKGMPDVSGRGKGDLLVTVRGTTPSRLTRDQRRLLEELAATITPATRDAATRTRGSSARSKISLASDRDAGPRWSFGPAPSTRPARSTDW